LATDFIIYLRAYVFSWTRIGAYLKKGEPCPGFSIDLAKIGVTMASAEKYLRRVISSGIPLDLARQVHRRRLPVRLARHSVHGFSVQFSEHRNMCPRDPRPRLEHYTQTDKVLSEKFEAETNITGYLVMDLSASMVHDRKS